jgi:hypothetical protein
MIAPEVPRSGWVVQTILGHQADSQDLNAARRPDTLEAVVGTPREWSAPWGCCWIVPLYHPSPVNGARWRRNEFYLERFLKEHSHPALCIIRGRAEREGVIEVKGDCLIPSWFRKDPYRKKVSKRGSRIGTCMKGFAGGSSFLIRFFPHPISQVMPREGRYTSSSRALAISSYGVTPTMSTIWRRSSGFKWVARRS